MPKTIYELTLENLPDGILRVSQKCGTAADGKTAFSVQQIDMFIGFLRKCNADVVKISGESVISENRPAASAEGIKAQHRRDQESSSKTAWRNRNP